ncbi:MAG: transposase [Pirellulaceae bacterium]
MLYEALQIHKVELFSFQLMPNHDHLVLRPLVDGDMSRFMGWIGGTHTMRYHAHYHTSGMGHVYQQRYKSFPIQDDDHFFVVCRYARAKRFAGRTCRASRTVTLGIALALGSQTRTQTAAFIPLADAPPCRLGRACQRASFRARIGSGPIIGAAW